MSDLSALSDAELQNLYSQKKTVVEPARMTDDELKTAYAAKSAQLDEKPSIGEDVAKSGGIGLVKGAVGLAGLPGEAKSLIGSGLSYLESKLGRDPEAIKKSDAAAQDAPSILPTSGGIQSAIESKTGDFYKPKTTAGEYAQTIGEFAPGILGGPGGIVRRGLTQVVAPAVASESAGQLTKGAAAEPYARVAGALVGGIGASKIADSLQPSGIPTRDALQSAVTSGYNHPEVKALEIKPSAAAGLSTDIKGSMLKAGVDDITAPQTTKIIERLATPRFGPTTTIEDLDGARKALSNVAPAEMRAAAIARSNIDNYLGNVPQTDLIAGNAANANKVLLEARANSAALKKGDDISRALANADINTGASYSGGNIDNATRQQLKPILKGILKKSTPDSGVFYGYSPQEVDALKTAVIGTPAGNIARLIGKMGPHGGLMGGGHALAAYASGGATIPISIATEAAKLAGDYSTARNAAKASDLIRSNSPLGKSMAPLALPPTDQKRLAVINALLASQGNRQPVMQGQ